MRYTCDYTYFLPMFGRKYLPSSAYLLFSLLFRFCFIIKSSSSCEVTGQEVTKCSVEELYCRCEVGVKIKQKREELQKKK